MIEYQNPAGRLLHVFVQWNPVDEGHSSKFKLQQFAEATSVSANWPAVLRAIADLEAELQLLSDDMKSLGETSPKYRLYLENLSDIEGVLRSIGIDRLEHSVRVSVSKKAVFALTYMAADLPRDDAAEQSDLDRIRELVSELQREIEASTDFSRSVREWLLDLLRIIRDSLDRYAIRGSRGMRQQFAMLVGELTMNWNTAEKVRQKNPGIWQKFTTALDVMYKITSLSEKCKPALEFAQKFLPLVKELLLPAPGSNDE